MDYHFFFKFRAHRSARCFFGGHPHGGSAGIVGFEPETLAPWASEASQPGWDWPGHPGTIRRAGGVGAISASALPSSLLIRSKLEARNPQDHDAPSALEAPERDVLGSGGPVEQRRHVGDEAARGFQ